MHLWFISISFITRRNLKEDLIARSLTIEIRLWIINVRNQVHASSAN